MSDAVQTVVVLAIVVTAALYLGRCAYRAVFGVRGGGCSTGCGKCAANEPAVVGIQPLTSPGEKRTP